MDAGAIVSHPIRAADAADARRLIGAAFEGTRYASRMLELLASTLGSASDDEHRGWVARSTDRPGLRGLALYGAVAGARDACRLHALLGDDPDLVLELHRSLRADGAWSRARVVVCELPEDAPPAARADVLQQAGYREEGRIDDLVRDGVALRLLVWRPGEIQPGAC